jgi:hypothetical protein
MLLTKIFVAAALMKMIYLYLELNKINNFSASHFLLPLHFAPYLCRQRSGDMNSEEGI